MRNMSFSLTGPQFRQRSKTVTRRDGWAFLQPGDVVMGCAKCMGLKKGQHIHKYHPIVIVSCRSEPIAAITSADVIAEGFPEWADDPNRFVRFLCDKTGKKPTDHVNRIQFIHIRNCDICGQSPNAEQHEAKTLKRWLVSCAKCKISNWSSVSMIEAVIRWNALCGKPHE